MSDDQTNFGAGVTASQLGGIQTAADSVLPDSVSSSLDSGIALAQQYGILPPSVTQQPTPPAVTPTVSTSLGISKPILIAGLIALTLFFVWKH